MRILVLGGTLFLSRAVVQAALDAGHEVVCAARGTSGAPPDGARLVRWDRNEPTPAELADTTWDAVVDVARTPSWVRTAVGTWPTAHWVLVSTISVYADDSVPDGRPGTLPLHPPRHDDPDLTTEPDAYGPAKVACEEAVGAAASASIVRPGLIVGPGDPTGRFTYWPVRLAAGGEVLAPGDPADTAQVIDVRDLADWAVHLAAERRVGTWDAVGQVHPLAELLAQVSRGVGGTGDLTWVDQGFLTAEGIDPWSGPGSLPLWLPRPDYDGMLAHDPEPARAAGMQTRPLADTARDTLAWYAATPGATVTGIDRARERDLLDLWARR